MPDSLHCRFARDAELDELARLVAHSFPGPTRTADWWREQLRDPPYGGGVETLFVGEHAGRPVAACQLHRLRQWIGGVAFDSAGVGTVSISPAHRRRGHAATMLTHALRAARERGDAAAALYPFRADYYRRLGFGQAGAALQYQVPPDALPDSAERQRVAVLDDDRGRAAALEVYTRWARTQTGQLERSTARWTQLCDAAGRVLVGCRTADGGGGELDGYALVTYRTDLPVLERYLEVDELVWTTPAARRALYGWLASLGDQWPLLLLRALPSHALHDWLREPRLPHGAAPAWGLWAPAATLLLGPMFRLLDVPGAWARRRVAADASLAITVDVDDAQLDENRGRWRLAFERGTVDVARDGAADAVIRLDVATLSRLFIGGVTATGAHAAGLLECDAPARLPALDAALALPEPWTFDRF